MMVLNAKSLAISEFRSLFLALGGSVRPDNRRDSRDSCGNKMKDESVREMVGRIGIESFHLPWEL